MKVIDYPITPVFFFSEKLISVSQANQLTRVNLNQGILNKGYIKKTIITPLLNTDLMSLYYDAVYEQDILM